MNCFMGYNPLATKQVKVTVWVCEQDGATPVAPSNPSEGDCFIVYATDEAVLSNTPTSAKSYSNGEWADAEGGGGGGGTVPIFVAHQDMTVTCEISYSDFVSIMRTAGLENIGGANIYPCVLDMHEAGGVDSVLTAELLTSEDTIYADMGDGHLIAYDGEGIRIEEI